MIVEVEEAKRPFSGDLGVFSKPEVSPWSHYIIPSSFGFTRSRKSGHMQCVGFSAL